MLSLLPKKFTSIQTRLLFSYFILIALIVSFIGIGVYKVSERIIEDEVGRSRTDVLNQISRNIGTVISEIESVSNLYYFDDDLLDIVNSPVPTDPYDKRKEESKVNDVFTKYIYSYEKQNIKYNAFLYTFSGKAFNYLVSDYYKNFINISRKPWYKSMVEKDGEILWVSTYNDKEGYGSNKYVFSAARLMKHKITEKPIGVLLLNIEEGILYNAYKSTLGISNIIYIIDRDGNIVSDQEKSKLGNKIEHADEIEKFIYENVSGSKVINMADGRILISFHPINSTGWTIVEEVPLRVLLKPLGYIRYYLLVMLLLSLFIALILSYFIARRITYPIKTLYNLMREVRKGNMEVAIKMIRNDEIGEFVIGFNRMVSTIKELMEGIRKEEKLKRRAEFDFLQAQINPHFMYNTLYSIKCMVSMGKNESAENMLMSFIRLLRKTFQNEDEFISIEDELSNLKDYVLIQSFRYLDKFDVVYNICDEIMDCKILKLILQPLVENAIFHGIEPKREKGFIRVSGRQENEVIILKVEDNGVGMTGEQIRNLWSRNNKSTGREFNKIGFFNVHERIALNFGETYGLKIESIPGEGTVIEIKLPVVRASTHSNNIS